MFTTCSALLKVPLMIVSFNPYIIYIPMIPKTAGKKCILYYLKCWCPLIGPVR